MKQELLSGIPLTDRPSDQVQLLIRDLLYGRNPAPHRLETWDQRHLTVMRSHGVAPWIYAIARNRPELGLPEQLFDDLRNEYHKSVLQSMRHEACVRRLTDSFTREGIPLILLKGAYLGMFVYDKPALRPMCDVDVLVTEADLDRVRELLQELGFVLAIDVPQAFKPHLYPSRPYVKAGAAPEILDLHSALWAMDHYYLDSETIWRNSVQAEAFGSLTRILTAEMNFIQIAAHILGHPPLFRDRLDLMMILTRLEPDWNTILDLAATLGFMRPLYWVLVELTRDWECSPPHGVLDSLGAYRPSRIEDLVIKSRFRYFWRGFSRLNSQKGLREKCQFLRLRVFPSPEYREAVIGTRNLAQYVHSKLRYFLGLYRKT